MKKNLQKNKLLIVLFLLFFILMIIFIFNLQKQILHNSLNKITSTQNSLENDAFPWVMYAGKKLYIQPSGSNKEDGSGTEDAVFSWEEASEYCNALNSNKAHGHDDWYLPSIDQWAAIYFYEKRDDYSVRDIKGIKKSIENNKDLVPFKNENYWSSSSYAEPYGYYIYMFCGTMTGHYKYSKYYARCVRDQ